MHNGLNMHGMIIIEVGFHMTMLACGVTLTIGLVRLGKRAAVG